MSMKITRTIVTAKLRVLFLGLDGQVQEGEVVYPLLKRDTPLTIKRRIEKEAPWLIPEGCELLHVRIEDQELVRASMSMERFLMLSDREEPAVEEGSR